MVLTDETWSRILGSFGTENGTREVRETDIRKFKAKLAGLGLTLKELADKAEITKATLYRKLYHASDTINLREIKAIQKSLNLTPEELWAIFICPESTENGNS